MFHVPEKFRVLNGRMGSNASYGNNGAFIVKLKHNQTVAVIASDEGGWQHVSVSRNDRCPNWEEMSQIKNLFWDEDDWVVQFHPAKSDYINNHPNCLHLWAPVGTTFPTPPKWMVGV